MKRNIVTHYAGLQPRQTVVRKETSETKFPSAAEIDEARMNEPGPLGQPSIKEQIENSENGSSNESDETARDADGLVVATGEVPGPKENVKEQEEAEGLEAGSEEERSDSTAKRDYATLDRMSKDELKALAEKEKVEVKSNATKMELITALRKD